MCQYAGEECALLLSGHDSKGTVGTQSMIGKDVLIEDLVNSVPGAVTYLMDQGIRCIACGEPIWGTLESAAHEKGYSEEEIDRFVRDLSRIGRTDRTDENS